MLEMRPLAEIKLTEYLQSNNIASALQIFLTSGGCVGPTLALALDDQKENGEIFKKEHFNILVNKDLIKQYDEITVDFIETGTTPGFTIQMATPFPGSECSSGTYGSSCC